MGDVCPPQPFPWCPQDFQQQNNMKNSHIEWTDHTFNPWEGCTKVSPGCAHCYAESRNARFGGGTAPNWGKGAPRRRTSVSNWNQPLKWDREAAASGVRPRVFCASLADWLDDEVPIEWLADLLDLIRRTPNLDWLLLTKRPQNWRSRIDHASTSLIDAPELYEWLEAWMLGTPPANVWVGTSVENQPMADARIPLLLEIPAAVRFLSMEPLLGEVRPALRCTRDTNGDGDCDRHPDGCPSIHWVIVGGESGPHARPMRPDWARSIRDQCKAAGVPFHFKQWGEWAPSCNHGLQDPECAGRPTVNMLPYVMYRVGKKAAGRLLDGVEHNGVTQGFQPTPTFNNR